MFQIPSEDNRIVQTNIGHTGNIHASYNIDLSTYPGSIVASGNVSKLLNNGDDADFDGYAAQFLYYNDKYYALSDKVFEADTATGTWTETGSSPSTGNTATDAVVFDSLLLIQDGDDIQAYNGSSWSSWWKGTLSQSGLDVGQRFFLKVGADGNLYIVDSGTKVYRVTTAGSVSKSGAGTLDFSATKYSISCVESNSSRLWFGTTTDDGEAVVVEWDMGPQSISANRLHPIGARAVRCIAIWNDIPVVVLSDGNIKYFDGNSFVNWQGARFPLPKEGTVFDDNDFIHPNGWAIIDSMPHFLVSGSLDNELGVGGVAYDETINQKWNMPSGVWCLDTQVGLYHRFAVGSGASTQDDYGQITIADPGALFAVNDGNTKFLASYDYYADSSTLVSALVCQDEARSNNARGFIATPFLQSFDTVWKMVKILHRKVASGDEIRIYYRIDDNDAVVLDGSWGSTTEFHTTDDATNVSDGDVAIVKLGSGSGQVMRISEKQSSTNTTVLVMDEANTYASAGDTGAIDVLNFRRIGTITNQNIDWHTFDIPATERTHKIQVLVELRTGSGNKNEVNYVIIE